MCLEDAPKMQTTTITARKGSETTLSPIHSVPMNHAGEGGAEGGNHLRCRAQGILCPRHLGFSRRRTFPPPMQGLSAAPRPSRAKAIRSASLSPSLPPEPASSRGLKAPLSELREGFAETDASDVPGHPRPHQRPLLKAQCTQSSARTRRCQGAHLHVTC